MAFDDDEGLSLEELGQQLQQYTDQVVLVINQEELQIVKLEQLKPFAKWELEDEDKDENVYTIRKLSSDHGHDDDSFDDEDNTYTVFRKDAFETLTKPIKSKSKSKSKGKSKSKSKGKSSKE